MVQETLSKGVRILRRVVIIMGFVLVFGFIALIVAAYFKFQNKPDATPPKYLASQTITKPSPVSKLPTPEEILPSLETPADKCIFKQNSDLAINGEIINYSLNNNILTIVTSQKDKTSLKEPEINFLTLKSQKFPAYPQQIIIFDLCKGEILSRVNLVEER